MRRAILGSGIAATFLSIGYLVEGLGYPMGTLAQPGAGIYPAFVGVVFLMASLGTVVETLLNPPAGEIQWPRGRAGGRIFMIMAAAIGYVIVLRTLGYIFAAATIVFLTLHGMGLPSWRLKIALTIAFALGSYFVFHALLSIPLPQGIWREILSG